MRHIRPFQQWLKVTSITYTACLIINTIYFTSFAVLITLPAPNSITCSAGEAVWNFPIDLALKSTCAFGWPRLALSVYAVDSLGRDGVVGYGSVLIPPAPGQHERWVYMYAPKVGIGYTAGVAYTYVRR